MKKVLIMVLVACLPFYCKSDDVSVTDSNIVFNFTIKNGNTNIVFHYDLNQAKADKKKEDEETRKRNVTGEVNNYCSFLGNTVTNDLSTMNKIKTKADWERYELEYAARLFSIGLFEASMDAILEATKYSENVEDNNNMWILRTKIKSARIDLVNYLVLRLSAMQAIISAPNNTLTNFVKK